MKPQLSRGHLGAQELWTALRQGLFSHTNCSSVLGHQLPDHPKTWLAGNRILNIHDPLSHCATFLVCCQLCQSCPKYCNLSVQSHHTTPFNVAK